MIKDDTFVQGFLNGDPKILSEIYTTSYHYVERYVLSHNGSKKDSEDIFQNALIHLYVKLKENKLNIQAFDKYLFTVCKNLWRRENLKNRVTNIDVVTLTSEELDIAAFHLEQEQWELYKEKFHMLSEQCQEILKLIFKKTAYSAIVKSYNYASETVARQRVFKCKSRLIQLIKRDEKYSRLKK